MNNTFPNIKKLEEKVRQGTPKYDFNARLDLDEIETFEKAYGIVLPESYKQFLERFNGVLISRWESASYVDMTEFEPDYPERDSFKLLSLDKIKSKFSDLRFDKWILGRNFYGNYPIIPICKMPESMGGISFCFFQ